jgi:hypothetical protein
VLSQSSETTLSFCDLNPTNYECPRAALIYQHATEDRDRAIADALAGLATATSPDSFAHVARPDADSEPAGKGRAPVEKGA